jgi:hypothetical protein
MAMSATYLTMNGIIVHENRGGVQRDYVPDTLGSTTALTDNTQTKTDTWQYWPYGEVSTRTGTSNTPFTFVGTLGYSKDQLDKLFYVRARHLRVDLAGWQTLDPLWPQELAFVYCDACPVACADPSGAQRGGITTLPRPTTDPPSWWPYDEGPTAGAPRGTGGLLGCLTAVIMINLWWEGEERKRKERKEKHCDQLRDTYKRLCGDFRQWKPCTYEMDCDEIRSLTEKYKMCMKKREEFKRIYMEPLLWDKGHEYPINLARQLYQDCLQIRRDICGG